MLRQAPFGEIKGCEQLSTPLLASDRVKPHLRRLHNQTLSAGAD
jgi:hypothetical protein